MSGASVLGAVSTSAVTKCVLQAGTALRLSSTTEWPSTSPPAGSCGLSLSLSTARSRPPAPVPVLRPRPWAVLGLSCPGTQRQGAWGGGRRAGSRDTDMQPRRGRHSRKREPTPPGAGSRRQRRGRRAHGSGNGGGIHRSTRRSTHRSPAGRVPRGPVPTQQGVTWKEGTGPYSAGCDREGGNWSPHSGVSPGRGGQPDVATPRWTRGHAD